MLSTLLSFLLYLILQSVAGNVFRRWQYTIVGSKVPQPGRTVGCEGFYGSQSDREISGHQVSLYSIQFCLVNAFTCKQYKSYCESGYLKFSISSPGFMNNIYIYQYIMQTKKRLCAPCIFLIFKCKLVMKLHISNFLFQFWSVAPQ